MNRYLVTAGRDRNHVVEAADGAAALVACGYAVGTRDAAVFRTASERQIAALRDALEEATEEARGDDDEDRLVRCDDVRCAVHDAERGDWNALVRCLYLGDEMLEARAADEVWP